MPESETRGRCLSGSKAKTKVKAANWVALRGFLVPSVCVRQLGCQGLICIDAVRVLEASASWICTTSRPADNSYSYLFKGESVAFPCEIPCAPCTTCEHKWMIDLMIFFAAASCCEKAVLALILFARLTPRQRPLPLILRKECYFWREGL